MTKNVSGFAVVFDFGAESGKTCGIYSQADVVHNYGTTLYEALEDYDVAVHFVETRKRPHKSLEEYLATIPDYYVTLVISCGWEDCDSNARNISRIECSPDCVRLSKRICEALFDWGKCYVYDHVTSDPIVMPDARKLIVIKPFKLNGVNSSDYLPKLDRLGKDIARVIGEWSKEYRLCVRGR